MSGSLSAEPFRMSLAAVVQHLQVLEEAGLVKTEKLGQVRRCRVESNDTIVIQIPRRNAESSSRRTYRQSSLKAGLIQCATPAQGQLRPRAAPE